MRLQKTYRVLEISTSLGNISTLLSSSGPIVNIKSKLGPEIGSVIKVR